MQIVRARTEAIAEMNRLIAASKSHWNYPAEYLRQALPLLKITAEYLAENLAFEIINDGQKTVGFFAVSENKGEKHLDHLWILPEYIGHGYGQAACRHLFKLAVKQGWREILVLPDPFAEGFYKKVGFVDTGMRVPSRVANGPTFSIFKINFDVP